VTVPYWIQDAIFYQIFPDRFANGDLRNDPPNVKPWGSIPTAHGFQGGDLRGIIEKFDYLLDLGVNAIYLNPIFQSSSNHRYNTYDYFRIDPKLGDMKDFHVLLNVAHSNNIRVILDGVFNHCSRGFFAFDDILENGRNSPYLDWFHIKHTPVDAYSDGEAQHYLAWWGHKSLPKFNTDNLAVRKYLLSVARYWIEQGADGWRLDVPNEIDDNTFWAEFRHVVKAVNRDAYLVGEIWAADRRWVGENHFDGLMNYPLREALLDFLDRSLIPASGFAEKIEDLLEVYPRVNRHAMYLPLGSHDTERLMTVLGHNLNKVKLAYLFLFAFPGAPAIYYADEIGLTGGKDPGCRGAFPWREDDWIIELRGWVKSLISWRKRLPSIRRGEFLPVTADDRSSCYVFARMLGDEKVLVVMNASPSHRKLNIPVESLEWEDGYTPIDLLGISSSSVSGGILNLDLLPWTGAWLK
jgi:cyclomaltodextrinase / maltogenic alpha-amylase / neopullulanase